MEPRSTQGRAVIFLVVFMCNGYDKPDWSKVKTMEELEKKLKLYGLDKEVVEAMAREILDAKVYLDRELEMKNLIKMLEGVNLDNMADLWSLMNSSLLAAGIQDMNLSFYLTAIAMAFHERNP